MAVKFQLSVFSWTLLYQIKDCPIKLWLSVISGTLLYQIKDCPVKLWLSVFSWTLLYQIKDCPVKLWLSVISGTLLYQIKDCPVKLCLPGFSGTLQYQIIVTDFHYNPTSFFDLGPRFIRVKLLEGRAAVGHAGYRKHRKLSQTEERSCHRAPVVIVTISYQRSKFLYTYKLDSLHQHPRHRCTSAQVRQWSTCTNRRD
jgi:hypothetical protein